MMPHAAVLWKTPLTFLALWLTARMLGKKHFGQLWSRMSSGAHCSWRSSPGAS